LTENSFSTLETLGITHKRVTLPDTNHNLGKYYELAGDTMIDFLAERLAAKSVPVNKP
jgi:hypothetical protein